MNAYWREFYVKAFLKCKWAINKIRIAFNVEHVHDKCACAAKRKSYEEKHYIDLETFY